MTHAYMRQCYNDARILPNYPESVSREWDIRVCTAGRTPGVDLKKPFRPKFTDKTFLISPI
jgi:hypothetical protein